MCGRCENGMIYIGGWNWQSCDCQNKSKAEVRNYNWQRETVKTFPVWRTIELGTFSTVALLKQALLDSKMKIHETADVTFGEDLLPLSREKREIKLVKVKGTDLGLGDSATLVSICARALDNNLLMCPPEVGPQLRLQYKDQPRGERVDIAMRGIFVNNTPLMYGVGRTSAGAKWIFAGSDIPNDVYTGEDLVFVMP
jgi:hypothetical protein